MSTSILRVEQKNRSDPRGRGESSGERRGGSKGPSQHIQDAKACLRHRGLRISEENFRQHFLADRRCLSCLKTGHRSKTCPRLCQECGGLCPRDRCETNESIADRGGEWVKKSFHGSAAGAKVSGPSASGRQKRSKRGKHQMPHGGKSPKGIERRPSQG